MAMYLVQTSYTTQALSILIKNPQNRTEVVRKAAEKFGGKLVGQWLSFGDYDVTCIFEMPDNVSAAALSLAVSAGGTVTGTKTTPLLTIDEGMAALKKAGTSSYKPVSAK
ncbi:MAG TPA: GYD domain-containing protein [Terracidiphilus sp.]|nr:GYD domain-containing protein [Terracidiphilus sp.]